MKSPVVLIAVFLLLSVLLLCVRWSESQGLDATTPDAAEEDRELTDEEKERLRVAIEAPDGSVCFNRCSGHGDCIDYSCHCHAGYLGDDCSTTFAPATADHLVPILTAGHFNVTRKNITQTISKHRTLLIGFSSYACHKCIQAEGHYEELSEALRTLKIPFARANADEMKSLASEFGANELPALVFFHKMRPTLYRGYHTAQAVLQYVKKQIGAPVQTLKRIQDVDDFFSQKNKQEYTISTVMVVGFFTQHEDVEEDEYADFVDLAKELQHNADIYFAVVTDKRVVQHYKTQKKIDRTPSLLMVGESGQFHSINLDEFFGESFGVKEWLLKKSVPLAGKITNSNFALYEKVGNVLLTLSLFVFLNVYFST
jgi:thiol-disulfide isomerase/thioredoxin